MINDNIQLLIDGQPSTANRHPLSHSGKNSLSLAGKLDIPIAILYTLKPFIINLK